MIRLNKKAILPALLVITSILHSQNSFTPPATPAKAVTDTLHGVYITDNYRWLENKEDPKVIKWTKAQNDYGIEYLNATQKMHNGLKEELTNIMDRDYEGPLTKVGKRVFQNIRKKGEKQTKIYTLLNGGKILIWDPEKIDPSGNTSTNAIEYTYDGEKAAVSVQKNGAEIESTYIIDTKNGKIIQGPFENVKDFYFTKDQQHAYITIRSEDDVKEQRPLKTYLWKLGSPIKDKEFIGTTTDAKNYYFIYDSRYSDVSFYGEGDFSSNHCYIRKTGSKEKGTLIYESEEFVAFPSAIQDKIYILTNDNAPRKRLMLADKNNPHYANWKTLIPEGETVMENFDVFKNGQILIQDKKDINSRLTLFDANGKMLNHITLPEDGNINSFSYDREEDSLYISISTFTSPGKTYVASPSNFKWRLYYSRKQPVDMSNITGSIQFYTSKDGTKIPCMIVHRKDMKLDGNNPVLLTGYGGFQMGIQPNYMGYYSSFINRGGIVVEAGIRGGDEYGEEWHQQGMLANKQNCFDDFNACAEWLIKEKYTNPSKIVAEGGSNGGLLMGAIALQRPELYKAIVCNVPLLDMLRYHQFLIARYWIPEYGDPDNMPDFSWLLRYSPYHNVRQGVGLPTMLISTGANDSRVDPLHAKKFAAALQNNPGQINPVILHIDYNSGHGSGKSTEHIIENAVFNFEFIMNQLGM